MTKDKVYKEAKRTGPLGVVDVCSKCVVQHKTDGTYISCTVCGSRKSTINTEALGLNTEEENYYELKNNELFLNGVKVTGLFNFAESEGIVDPNANSEAIEKHQKTFLSLVDLVASIDSLWGKHEVPCALRVPLKRAKEVLREEGVEG